MKTLTTCLRGTLFLVTIFFLNSCVKDHCTNTYSYFLPMYKTSAEVRANVKSNAPQDISIAGKIFIKGKYIFLNEIDRGIHVIDNSNPASPRNISFIDIPGNMDLAVRANYLYADSYTDLAVIDISDPVNVKAVKFVDNAFPYRAYLGMFSPDSSRVIVNWIKRDTTVTDECGGGGFFGNKSENRNWLMYTDVMTLAAAGPSANYSPNASSNSPFGIGGSTARFAVQNNFLYTVSTADLNVFDISTANNPSYTNKINISFNIETIYPFKNKLFIGAATGMFIYDVSNGNNPIKQGTFGHIVSCDPVIADDNNAYVTLRTGNSCQGITNELETLDISDLSNPKLLSGYTLTNPRGLSKDGNILFVCDGPDGLKVYDATDPMHLKLINNVTGIDPNDVIAWNHIALVVTSNGIYQYDYSDVNNIQFLSKIEIQQ